MSKQYKLDSIKAKNYVYDNKGKGPCPFGAGTRLERLWIKWNRHYWRMESKIEDMVMAYGEFRPDRLKSLQDLADADQRDGLL